MHRSPRFRAHHAAGLAVSAATLAWMLSAGAALAGDSKVELLFDPPPDQVFRYHLDSSVETNAQGVQVSMVVAAEASMSRVMDAKSDNVVLEIQFSKVDASMRQGENMQPLDVGLAGQKVRVEVTTRGKLLKIDPSSESSAEQKDMLENLSDALFIELPDKPVKVGDTWKQAIDGSKKGLNGSGDFTLEKIEKKQGLDSAHITADVVIEGTEPPVKGKGTVESDVATSGGYLIGSKGSIALQGQGPTAVQSFELKLVK